jgi:hypothetical protein
MAVESAFDILSLSFGVSFLELHGWYNEPTDFGESVYWD